MHMCNVMLQRKKMDKVRQGDRYREHGRSTEGGKSVSGTETNVRERHGRGNKCVWGVGRMDEKWGKNNRRGCDRMVLNPANGAE